MGRRSVWAGIALVVALALALFAIARRGHGDGDDTEAVRLPTAHPRSPEPRTGRSSRRSARAGASWAQGNCRSRRFNDNRFVVEVRYGPGFRHRRRVGIAPLPIDLSAWTRER